MHDALINNNDYDITEEEGEEEDDRCDDDEARLRLQQNMKTRGKVRELQRSLQKQRVGDEMRSAAMACFYCRIHFRSFR